MKNTVFLFFLLAITFLFSCESEIEIEIDFLEEGLVTNASLEAGKIPEISFFKTTDPLNYGWEGAELLRNVNAVLIDEEGNEHNLYMIQYDEWQDDYYIGREFYTDSTLVLQENKTYRLEASHPKYGTLSAEDIIPSKFDSLLSQGRYLNIIKESNNDFFDFENLDAPNILEIKLNKTHENQQFVIISAIHKMHMRFTENPEPGNDFESNRNIYFNSTDQNVDNLYGSAIVNISDYELGEITIRLNASILFYRENELNDPYLEFIREELIIDAVCISPAYRRYMISLINNDIDDPFQEPSPVYSNIEGGYGVFATFNQLRFTGEVID